MDRHLLDYLPPVLREVLEFRTINEACEPEFYLAWNALALVLANQFLETADSTGVSVWEKELCIYPKDTDTLELRKARIKAMWNRELPYTITWLRNWITGICGPEGHIETVSDYAIDIQLDYSVLPDADRLRTEILDMLLPIRPANMWLQMRALIQSYASVAVGAVAESAATMDVWPLVPRAIEATAELATPGALSCRATLEIYPTGGTTHA